MQVRINKNKITIHYIFLFVYSFIMKYLHSFNSPRFDDFSIYSDNAIFYSIGRAILDGKILYKDVFDHKTPYIYFINALAAMIPWHHVGLYIIECIVLFISLFFTYKILILVINKDSNSDSWIALFGSIFICFLLNNANITLGVTRTEAYAVVCMLSAAYLFLKFFINGNLYVNFNFPLQHMFIVGILATISFMTNIRAAILFIPFAIAVGVVLLIEKKFINLLLVFLTGIAGIFITIFPYVIYMLVTDSASDMFYAVFHINSIYANNDAVISGFPRNAIEMLVHYIKIHPIIFTLTLISLIASLLLLKRFLSYNKQFEKNEDNSKIYHIRYIALSISIVISMLICISYIIFSNRISTYYNVVLLPYFLIPYILIFSIIKRPNKIILIILAVSLFLINFLCGFNLINVRYKRDRRIALEMRDNANRKLSSFENKKVFALGFNPNVYIYFNSSLDYKFFIVPKIKYSYEKLPFEEQYRYILNERPDIVIYSPDFVYDEFPKQIKLGIKQTLSKYYEFTGVVETGDDTENYGVYVKK